MDRRNDAHPNSQTRKIALHAVSIFLLFHFFNDYIFGWPSVLITLFALIWAVLFFLWFFWIFALLTGRLKNAYGIAFVLIGTLANFESFQGLYNLAVN